MSLEVGIVGLPNAGKSTLFNALAGRKLAKTSEVPFTTIEPHKAVVEVPDGDLEKLSKLVKPESTVFATVTFTDIAGLVKGAHKGEGLGNQFLGKIREVDAIIHVVRAFENPSVSHPHPSYEPGSEKQALEDIEIVNIELELGEIKGKPTIYVLNVNESIIGKKKELEKFEKAVKAKVGKAPVIIFSAKFEEELTEFGTKQRQEYLKEYGVKESGLEKLIKQAYKILGLISFYTIKGGKEVHAWSIKSKSTALEAAEKVHTDFAKKFIKAEVIGVSKLLSARRWLKAKEKGLVRLEGRDYRVKDQDVIEFKIGK
jgi:ribosome-binding ATPase YchF (GTP1/OBG family)